MYYISDICPTSTNNLAEIAQSISIEVFKPYGMTPVELVNAVVRLTGAKKGAFSGRLDPMACGSTRIFLDENCKYAKSDLTAGKRYRFQMVIGLETTSLDMLGFPTSDPSQEIVVYGLLERIERFLDQLVAINYNYYQRLPKYSSYPVANQAGIKKPLWWWARENRLDEITIPRYKKILYQYYGLKLSWVSIATIAHQSIERIRQISPEMKFNQQEIVEAWLPYTNRKDCLPVIEMTVNVSSGFYIRQLVEDLGQFLETPTATVEIERLGYLS